MPQANDLHGYISTAAAEPEFWRSLMNAVREAVTTEIEANVVQAREHRGTETELNDIRF
jgi:hypothetical protein